MDNEGVVTIKLSESEIQLMLNSLRMSISTLVPCVDSGEWKVPYEQLESDIENILKQLRNYKREVLNDKKKEPTSYQEPQNCDPCE